MRLYLVRWADLTASIIRASSERELLQIIDEVGTPGSCEYWPYSGPIWIDFHVTGKHHFAKPTKSGRIRESEVVFDVSPSWLEPIKTGRFDGADTAWEMIDTVTKCAFPNLFDHINSNDFRQHDELTPPPNEDAFEKKLAKAAAKDSAMHSARSLSYGVEFASPGTDELVRVEYRLFYRTHFGTFKHIDLLDFDDFIHGIKPLNFNGEEDIHLAFVSFRGRGRHRRARLAGALKLRVRPDGHISAPHQADAYDPRDEDTQHAISRHLEGFRARRNLGVQWRLSPDDAYKLSEALRKRYPSLRYIDLTARRRP